MQILEIVAGLVLIGLALRDAFLAILLPRTVGRGSPITRRYTVASWRAFSSLVRPGTRFEDSWLSIFGPLSIVGLIALWATLLIIGFGLLIVGFQLGLNGSAPTISSALYLSGVTFLTLGFGDVVMVGNGGHVLSVIEAGVGFGFLAIVVSYLPVLYNSFSRREALITLMDARGGSPPSGGEMLRRFAAADDWDGLVRWLERWETWAAELLETHLSYPTLAYYRSQHSDTSWLCAVTAVMDSCALLSAVSLPDHACDVAKRQAHLTLAMCRHAVVDLTQIYDAEPIFPNTRLSELELAEVLRVIGTASVHLCEPQVAKKEIVAACSLYGPYVLALSKRFRLSLPAWTKDADVLDNWETSAWDRHL